MEWKGCVYGIQSLISHKNLSSFLFDFSPFSLFLSTKATKHSNSTEMAEKKDVKTQSVDELEVLVGQGDMDAKRELARRLMEGNGVPQNHPKAVALLEDCVTLGDTEAMLMLAKCCAYGRGMEHDAERAESLICEAANKGNHEAACLIKLIDDWKGKDGIDLSSFSHKNTKRVPGIHFCVYHRANQGRIDD